MKTADFLHRHKAYRGVTEWALSVSNDMADVWDALIKQGNRDWLIWTAARPGVFPGTALRKLACRFVRETPLPDGRMVWDLLIDGRSRKAVEVADAYADGKATEADLEPAYAAAHAAAHDIANAAQAAAAGAAYGAVFADAAQAASYASCAAACAAYAAAAYDAYGAYESSCDSSYDTAYAAQIKMIAELGNPFREENDND